MVIKMLVENISDSKKLGCEHGLSLYIETKEHKILFDTGASDLFLKNAIEMNVDLSEVDIAVLSHGHYDHGGGLEAFIGVNKKAKIYINENAFGDYYANRKNSKEKYIGLDHNLLPNDRFVFVGNHFVIDNELELFSNVKGEMFNPSGNKDLFMRKGDVFLLDKFSHEQNLIIKENGKTLLVAGCAHRGIVNILEHFNKEKNMMPDIVIGGFHLYNRSTNGSEKPEIIQGIAEYLINTEAEFYTCHCTGIEAYRKLKTIIGKNMNYLSTGNQLTI